MIVNEGDAAPQSTETAASEPTLGAGAVEANGEETDEGDLDSDGDITYEAWLAKQNGTKAKEKKGGKEEIGKSKQVEAKDKEKARDPKDSKDTDGAEDTDVPGKGSGKAESAADEITYRVDGEDIKITKAEAIKRLQVEAAGEKRMQEAATIRKQAGEFINWVKQNPIAALAKVGIDFDKLAEDRIYEKLQYQAMPEHERKLHDTTKTLAEREAELKEFKEKQEASEKQAREAVEAERIEKATNEARTVLEQQMIHAMEVTGLPRNKFTVTRMALYMRDAIAKGYKDVTPMDVADFVHKDWQESLETQRKSEVERFKARGQTEQEPRVTTHKPAKTAKRRITSIYDLID